MEWCHEQMFELSNTIQLYDPEAVVLESKDAPSVDSILERATRFSVSLEYQKTAHVSLNTDQPLVSKKILSFRSTERLTLFEFFQFLANCVEFDQKNEQSDRDIRLFVESFVLTSSIGDDQFSQPETWQCSDLTLSYFQLTDKSKPRGRSNQISLR